MNTYYIYTSIGVPLTATWEAPDGIFGKSLQDSRSYPIYSEAAKPVVTKFGEKMQPVWSFICNELLSFCAAIKGGSPYMHKGRIWLSEVSNGSARLVLLISK